MFRDEIVPQYRPAVLRGSSAIGPRVQRREIRPNRSAVTLTPSTAAAWSTHHDASTRAWAPVLQRRHARVQFLAQQGDDHRDQRQALRYAKFDNRPSLVVQSALIADCLPGFAGENRLPVLGAIGAAANLARQRSHDTRAFDESNNVACVVSGTRRFTLFPPEQIANLYIGPLGHAPTGTPISLVSLANPDFKRFPRVRDALASALAAELGPGDAVYIPALWWHHVQSLAKYNILVNYWWKGGAASCGRGHGAQLFAALPADVQERAAGTPAGVESDLRPLCFQRGRNDVRAHSGTRSRRAGRHLARPGKAGEGLPGEPVATLTGLIAQGRRETHS